MKNRKSLGARAQGEKTKRKTAGGMEQGVKFYCKLKNAKCKRPGLPLTRFPQNDPFSSDHSRQQREAEDVGGPKTDGMGRDPSEKRP